MQYFSVRVSIYSIDWFCRRVSTHSETHVQYLYIHLKGGCSDGLFIIMTAYCYISSVQGETGSHDSLPWIYYAYTNIVILGFVDSASFEPVIPLSEAGKSISPPFTTCT